MSAATLPYHPTSDVTNQWWFFFPGAWKLPEFVTVLQAVTINQPKRCTSLPFWPQGYPGVIYSGSTLRLASWGTTRVMWLRFS